MEPEPTRQGEIVTEHPQDQPSYGQQPQQSAYGQQPQQPGPGPAYGYRAQPPVSPGDARMWSVFAHLGPILLSFLVPVVIYLVYKDRDPFIRRHAAQAMNFHITIFIIYIVSFPLMLVIIGFFTFILAMGCSLLFSIIAAVTANEGREYTYPLTPRMIT